jgi:hypothetical protein
VRTCRPRPEKPDGGEEDAAPAIGLVHEVEGERRDQHYGPNAMMVAPRHEGRRSEQTSQPNLDDEGHEMVLLAEETT